MVEGLRSLGVDALNVAVSDAWALEAMESLPEVPLVSANVSGPGIVPSKSFDRGVRVAVTGLTVPGPAFLQPEGYVLRAPREVRSAIETLNEDHDLVVLLSYGTADEARRLARQGSVDVVIDVAQHRGPFAPARVGDAIWVRAHEGTARLGELRLRRQDGRWVAGERKVELDAAVPVSEPIRTYIRRARRETATAQRRTLGRVVR
jgi:2',3'-cyclic-nucleotide 2'-phosphodiesterase (5'-nucleotidase family)